jgi:serine/threonine-protein kinase
VATGREVTVLEGAPIAEFFPRNLLIYSQEGGLFARQFDPRALSVSGAATAIDTRLPNEQLAMSQAVFFTVSQTGVLVHLAGPPSQDFGLLTVADRKSGKEEPLRDVGARPRFLPLSGDKVVSEESAQIWLTDLNSGVRTRVTDGEILHYVAVPTPDGGRILASSYQEGPAQLVSHSLTVAGAPQQVTRGHSRRRYAASFAPDGRLAMVELGETTQTDILILQPDGTEREWLKTRYDERHPRFSPDGRWLAYTSDESGRSEVYVKPADSALRAVNVSLEGGEAPVWEPSGRELLFLRGEEIFAVTIEPGETVATSRPRAVLRVPGIAAPDAVSVPYDLSPDGQRLIYAKRSDRKPGEMRVVVGLGVRSAR